MTPRWAAREARAFTLEQRGAYDVLLEKLARQGWVPDEPAQLAAIVGTTRTLFVRHIASAVLPLLIPHPFRPGCLTHVRIAADLHRKGHRFGFVFENGEAIRPEPRAKAAEPVPAPPPSPEPVPEKKEVVVEFPKFPPADTTRSLRGKRLTDAWHPGADGIAYAEKLGLDSERALEDFRDYWIPKTGKNATSLDWGRTWKSWCRKAADFSTRRGQPPQPRLPLLAVVPAAPTPEPAHDPNDSWGVDALCADLLARGEGKHEKDQYGILRVAYLDRCYVDELAREVARLARMHRDMRPDWQVLLGWVRDGIGGRDILAAVKRIAALPDYRPSASLKRFDSTVRAKRGAA